MNATAHPVIIGTRLVLRVYAAVTMTLGAVLFIFAPFGLDPDLGGVPWLRAALIRIFGSLVVLAGCGGAALSRVEEPEARRSGLKWIGSGHTVVALVLILQQTAVLNAAWAGLAAALAWSFALLLGFAWQFGDGADARFGGLVSIFGEADANARGSLKSRYARGIRLAAAQEERNRLARDLHDSIKQQLFAIQTAAATAQARFDAEPAGSRVALEQIRESTRSAMGEMDAMLQGLRAAPLENVGLVEALKQACEALSFRIGARVDFVPGRIPSSLALPPGAQDAIFRVAQEALANIARHGRASEVRVTLDGNRRDFELTVKDDGAGFDQKEPPRGQGLANMRARAAEYGGHLELLTEPGHGTRVRLTIALTGPDPSDAKSYGWRALVFGGMGIFVLFVTLRLGGGQALIVNGPLALVILAQGAINAVAWHRVRKSGEVRR